MAKKNEDLRIDPEERICPIYDCVSIKLYHAPERKEMGVSILDNCAEEHIM